MKKALIVFACIVALVWNARAEIAPDIFTEILEHIGEDSRDYIRSRIQSGNIRMLDESSEVGLFQPSEQDKARGYAIFVRNYEEKITPRSTPKPAELTAELKSFTGKNTYKVMTFCIYPLVELGQVDASAGDLKTKTGDIIPAKNIEIRWAQYLIRPVPNTTKMYAVAEALLNKLPSAGTANITRRFWLQMTIPADAKPGDYESIITIKPNAKPAATITCKLKVMPFTLEENPVFSVGFFYSVPKNAAWLNEEIEDMSRHGFTSASSGGGTIKRGAADVDFTYLNNYYKACKKYKMTGLQFVGNADGIKGSPKDAGFINRYKQGITDLVDWQDDHPDMKMVHWITDEPREICDNGYSFNFMSTMELVDWCKKYKELKCMVTIMEDHDWSNKKIDYPKIAIKLDYLMTHHWKGSESIINIAKKKNAYIIYNSGINRFEYGFHVWRAGAIGKLEWHYMWVQPNLFMPEYEQWAVCYRDKNNFMNAIEFEKCAEGVSDHKYLYTLEKKIKANENSKDPNIKKTAEEANKFLKTLWNKIVDMPSGPMIAGREGINMSDLEVYRLKMAEYLTVLQ